MNKPETLKGYIQTFITKDRLGALLGARYVSLTSDECIYEYEFNSEHCNPNGILHGGALFTVMDSSQGMFIHSVLDDTYKTAATGTATVKYLAPVRSGKITVRTTLTKKEGRKLFVHSEALDIENKCVAVLDEIWIAILKE